MNLPAYGQHDAHDGHDHDQHAVPKPSPEKKEDHQKHEDHQDHAGHKDHDDHDGHDEHHEDEAIKLDAAMAKQFGIKTAKAGPGHLVTYLTLSGEVAFNADRMAHVTPAVSGIVSQVQASVGDRVKQGRVLARLSSRELAGMRSQWLASKARLELANENASRDQRLFNDKVGTERAMLESRQVAREAQIQYSLTENALHALGFTHEQIQQIDSENHQLNDFELIVPIDGVVTQRHLNMGENITPDSKDAAFVIADMSSVWVNLSVYQRDLAQIKAGQQVVLKFGHNLPDVREQIAFITPSMDEQTRTLTARVVMNNPQGHWRPGMFVMGKVEVAKQDAAVVVPRSAIVELEQGASVFVLHEDGFEPSAVKLGLSDDEHVQILDGLQPGQVYVSTNAFALKAQLQKGAFGDGHAH
jgi:cobalt-zinc-cadmium efflux system membrane fusion protein